jgi:hypothetical protein
MLMSRCRKGVLDVYRRLFDEATKGAMPINEKYFQSDLRTHITYVQIGQLNRGIDNELGLGEFGYTSESDPTSLDALGARLEEHRLKFVSAESTKEERHKRVLMWPYQDTVDVGHNPRGMVDNLRLLCNDGTLDV